METFNFIIPSQIGFSCGDATLLVVEESAQESHPLKRSGWLVDDDILGGSGVKLPTEEKINIFMFKTITIIHICQFQQNGYHTVSYTACLSSLITVVQSSTGLRRVLPLRFLHFYFKTSHTLHK